MARAALYVRVSSAEQADNGYSVAGQLRLLHAYCQQNGLTVYKEYVDAGISGKNLLERKAAQELLRDAKLAPFNVVLVWKLSRLARNLSDLLHITLELDDSNVALISVSESFDASTAQGKFTLQMLGAVGELERKQIGQNIALGRRQRAKRGLYSGPPVLGYDLVMDPASDSTLRLKVNHAEASLVQNIFELYASGKGLKAIVNQLNSAGRTTKQGKLFSIGTVSRILRNQLYIGMLNYTTLSSTGLKAKSVTQGRHEPIVGQALWEEVQSIYKGRAVRPKKTVARIYPLTGILKCPGCGSGMVPSHTITASRKRHFYYVCSRYLNCGSCACRSHSVKASIVESAVMKSVASLLMSPTMLQDLTNEINSQHLSATSKERDIAQELDKLEKARKKALQDYEADKMGKDEALSLLSSLRDRISVLRLSLSDVTKPNQPKLRASAIAKTLARLSRDLNHYAPEQSKRLLQLLVESIHLPNGWEAQGPEVKFRAEFIKDFRKDD